jgi:hypothetical protein
MEKPGDDLYLRLESAFLAGYRNAARAAESGEQGSSLDRPIAQVSSLICQAQLARDQARLQISECRRVLEESKSLPAESQQKNRVEVQYALKQLLEYCKAMSEEVHMNVTASTVAHEKGTQGERTHATAAPDRKRPKRRSHRR